jgi:hypothetical protein
VYTAQPQPEIAVSVSGIATNATVFGEADGSIAVTNSQGYCGNHKC